MPTRVRDYVRPVDLPGAMDALNRPGVRTRTLLLGPRPEALDDWDAEAVLDLSRLQLAFIQQDGDNLRLGPLASLQAVAESAHVRALAGGILSQAAELAGGLGMRHAAMLGGALVPGAGPPEVALALLALEAAVVVRGAVDREIPLAEFKPDPGELILELRVGARTGAGGSLQRVARTPRDQAIVAAAAALEVAGGVCRWARVAVAGAGPTPARLASVEALLAEKALTPALLSEAAETARRSVLPTSDYRGSAPYRAAMTGTLVSRAIAEAWNLAGG